MLKTSEQVELKPFNTFRVSAKARHFLQLDSVSDCQAALSLINGHRNRLVLGGGSNLLFIQDFDGLIIYPQIFGIEVLAEDDAAVLLSIGASQNWHEFVLMATDRGWFGLENLALIPGTVGASPVQNIGAYGVEVKQFIQRVHCIDLDTGESLWLTNEACQFGYRDSLFKRAAPGRYLITHIEFKLYKQPHLNLSYQPLAEYFNGHQKVTPSEVLNRVCEIRAQKLPDPQSLANAGSFFKNPVVSQLQFQSLQQRFADIVAFPTDEGVKLAAGWLIEKAGFKGVRQGDVGVHKHQALVLVNYGELKGDKIWQLAVKIQDVVEEQFGVVLEVEVRVIGAQAENVRVA